MTTHIVTREEHKSALRTAIEHYKNNNQNKDDFEAVCVEIVANVLHVPSTVTEITGIEDVDFVNEVCDRALESLMEFETPAIKALSYAIDHLDKGDLTEEIMACLTAYATELTAKA